MTQAYTAALIFLTILWVARAFLLDIYCIYMASMEPTLIPGDRVLTLKTSCFKSVRLKKGDVVALEHPLDASVVVIKRCAAVGGDFIDCGSFISVPSGHLFVLGDNGQDSLDSRQWGPVPESLVKGRLLLILISVEQSKLFSRKVRWSRSFRRVK